MYMYICIYIFRKAVKAFTLHLLYYEIFKYFPMSLFVENLVASCNLEKDDAKKCSGNFSEILEKYL